MIRLDWTIPEPSPMPSSQRASLGELGFRLVTPTTLRIILLYVVTTKGGKRAISRDAWKVAAGAYSMFEKTLKHIVFARHV